jgi:hypothetical protein
MNSYIESYFWNIKLIPYKLYKEFKRECNYKKIEISIYIHLNTMAEQIELTKLTNKDNFCE